MSSSVGLSNNKGLPYREPFCRVVVLSLVRKTRISRPAYPEDLPCVNQTGTRREPIVNPQDKTG
jgi:hypothetical protein